MKNHSQNQTEACQISECAAQYVCNKLPNIEYNRFKGHLSNCRTCTDMVNNLKKIMPILIKTQTIHTSDITAKVLGEIPNSEWATEYKQTATNHHAMRIFPLIYRMAALFLIVASSTYIASRLLQKNEPTSMPTQAKLATSEKTGAINAAASWLISTQESNGSWDPVKWEGKKNFEVSLTGMALMALLCPDGHGAKSYSQSIDKAVNYILSKQLKEGNFDSATLGTMYNHGIATLAILKVYKATKQESLIAPLTKAIDFICNQQLDSGGWGYKKETGQQANTSISAWQLQALMQAKDIGRWDVVPSFHKGLQWLQGLVNNEGMIGYRRANDVPEGSNSRTLTAMGAFCLLSAGKQITGLEDTNMQIKKALKTVASHSETDLDFYQSFFIASALHAADNKELDDALGRMHNTLVDHRVSSGSNAGTWDTVDHWSSVGGRLYTTSMASLSLQANTMPAPF